MSKKIKEIRILEDVKHLIEPKESQLVDIYGQDEQARRIALYSELEQQKAILNHLNNIQTNGNY
jgi:hypothetical protein